MTKKSEAPNPELKALKEEVEKKYKAKGLVGSASEIVDGKPDIISVSPALDDGLAGGAPEGTWMSVSGPPKVGKAQPVDALVYTPKGPVAIGSVRPGDLVCTPNGRVAPVESVHPQGVKSIYRVHFKDGDSVECCEDHLWEVRGRHRSRREVLPLKELRRNLLAGDGRPNWSVRLPVDCDFDERSVPLEPYLLGLLLGDGGLTQKSIRFTTADGELLRHMGRSLPKGHAVVPVSAGRVGYDYRISLTKPAHAKKNQVRAALKQLGLAGKSSRAKFIPEEYRYNSRRVRSRLLQGLMDTDGTADVKGNCSFSTTSPLLARDFKELAQSLGFLCRVRGRLTTCNGKRFKSFTCTLRGDRLPLAFRLGRKRNRTRFRRKKPLERRIVDVRYVGKKKAVCIKLQCDDGLYLTDHFVVTHNTTTLLSVAAQAQRPEHGGRTVLFIAAEHRLKQKNLVGVRGLDLHPDRFIHIKSSKDKILSAGDFLSIAEMYLKSIPRLFVIIDSISALVSGGVLEGGIGTAEMMAGPRLVSQFCDLCQALVPIQKSIVCGVTHIIADPKSQTGKREKAANRWLYQADIRLKATHTTPWVLGGSKNKDGYVVGGKQIGQIVHWVCQESALGPPNSKCDSYIRYGVGVDRHYELFEMGKAANLIEVNGSWYSLRFLENHKDLYDGKEVPKAQGAEAAFRLLETNPAWTEALHASVLAFLRPAA